MLSEGKKFSNETEDVSETYIIDRRTLSSLGNFSHILFIQFIRNF